MRFPPLTLFLIVASLLPVRVTIAAAQGRQAESELERQRLEQKAERIKEEKRREEQLRSAREAAQREQAEPASPKADAIAKLPTTGGEWTPLAPIYSGPPPAGDDGLPDYPLQREPSVVTRPDGSLVMVWLDKFKGDMNQFLWAERDPGDSQWSRPRVLHPDATTYWQFGAAKLVALPDGSVLALWRKTVRYSRDTPQISRLAPNASEWSAPEAPPEPLDQRNAFALGADGTLHAAWIARGPSGHGASPYYSRRAQEGTWETSTALRMRPPRTVRVLMEGGREPFVTEYTGGAEPRIAVRPDGAVLVVWFDNEETLSASGTRGRHAWYRVLDPASQTWSPERKLVEALFREPAGDARRNLTVAATADAFHVVESVEQESRLNWLRLKRGESEWTNPQPLLPTPLHAWTPRLSSRGETLFLTAFVSADTRQSTVMAAELPSGAESWRILPHVLTPPVQVWRYDVAFGAKGQPFVVAETKEERGLLVQFTEYLSPSGGN